MVGCVLVREGRVIGEGYHTAVGQPHAEPEALADCQQRGESPRRATAFVTLEPCCHTDKRTPPCVPTLIKAGISRVVAGALDPNPQVAGRGLAQLREAGVKVDDPPAEVAAECRQLIAPFVAGMLHRRPYVTAKWAESADGRVAGKHGRPIHLTGAAADAAVHGLRSRCDAIAVGTNTLVNDDPRLTVRGVEDPPRRPLRVVLSNAAHLPPASRLFHTPEHGPILIYTAADPADAPPSVEIVRLPATDTTRGTRRFAFADALADLHARGVTHLLLEPGPTLATALLSRHQINRIWHLTCPTKIIGHDGLPAPKLPPTLQPTATVRLGPDQLIEYLDPASPTFATATASADFSLPSGF
jgi:diaminohydroxyphosphoribosylaminopyrimidine deaminase/5-amino-6-(5-phosphoribosylamino)uracil reductase